MKKYLSVIVLLLLPLVTLAQTTVSTFHKTLPFLEGELTTENFIQALYNISIAGAAILVVIRLIWAGAQYMLSDVVTRKGEAVKQMQGALLGLIIIIGAVTFLQTINPSLLNLNVLGTGAPVKVEKVENINTGNNDNKFEPGEEYGYRDIRGKCGGDKQPCVSEGIQSLQESCKANGGSGITDYYHWWWGTIYKCN